jgi:hypothetical protein
MNLLDLGRTTVCSMEEEDDESPIHQAEWRRQWLAVRIAYLHRLAERMGSTEEPPISKGTAELAPCTRLQTSHFVRPQIRHLFPYRQWTSNPAAVVSLLIDISDQDQAARGPNPDRSEANASSDEIPDRQSERRAHKEPRPISNPR